MKNSKRCCIKILILLLIKVTNIQSGCSWESQKCAINCVAKNFWSPESIENIMEILEQEWTKGEV